MSMRSDWKDFLDRWKVLTFYQRFDPYAKADVKKAA